MLYQRKHVADMSDVGQPAELPRELVGLADESLADITAAVGVELATSLGYAGDGFFPVQNPPPPPSRWISQAIFLERMTAQKRIPIRTAAKTDPIIEDFLAVLSATVEVYLDDPNLTQALAYLVSQNLLTNADVAALTA